MSTAAATDVRTVARAYFRGLAQHDLSGIPWAADVRLRTPLNPEGGSEAEICGRDAVHAFFTPILPALTKVDVLRELTDGDAVAVRALIELANGRRLHVCDIFIVRDGEIIEQQNYYDPRPAM
jgi:limonene-1,2-epoxide hydrolase